MSNQLSVVSKMAERFGMDRQAFESTIKKTIFPSNNQNPTNEQLVSFLLVAGEYDLNPFTKEIYAYPSRGGIQPIVSIDGWLKIINSHPQFNGMEFVDGLDANGKIISITCKIFRKDREHASTVTEYLDECKMPTEPWKKYPARMLRHKAAIQCARYAFSFSGIVDPDEAERIKQGQASEDKSIQGDYVDAEIIELYPEDDFKKNLPSWLSAIEAGKRTADEVIEIVSAKGELTEEQQKLIRGEK